MLALTGRKGDGWLPSYGYMKPGDLGRGNAAIDEAAESVGRDPREIRRLLNVAALCRPSRVRRATGAAAHWKTASRRSSFRATTHDCSRASAPRSHRRPVSSWRGSELFSRTPAASVRSAAALSARRDAIAYDDVPAGLVAIEPGDFGYADVRSTYLRGGSPGIVLQPGSAAQVADAVGFARLHPDLPLAVRSGGHGISGRSTNDGGIVIDLRRLNDIEVLDEERRLVRIGPGARWMEVAAALGERGWALTSGDYGGVGVGGLATAGGIGFLAREHGLTIDHLRAAEVVLADGSMVRTDAATRRSCSGPCAEPAATSGS